MRADHEKHEHEDVLASDVIAELAQIHGRLSVNLVFRVLHYMLEEQAHAVQNIRKEDSNHQGRLGADHLLRHLLELGNLEEAIRRHFNIEI